MNLPAQPFFGTAAQRVALARQRFFDDGQRPSGLVGEAVIQSWNRCLSARRGPHEAVAFDPVSAVRAHTAAARSRVLLEAAQADLQQLETALAGTACRVLLTDGQGVIVHASRGSAAEPPGVMPLAARVGVNLAEGAIGTNAPGVVVHTGQPCTVYGGEHFFDCVQAMHCAAAPVRDAAGRLVAVLDVSIEHRPFGFDAASVVGVYATAIENRWLLAQAQDQLVLHFQASPALLGTPLEALAAVGGDGRLAWLNSVARRLLADAAPGETAEALFGLPLPGLLALTRRDDLALLHLPAGLAVWLRARLHARDGLAPTPSPDLPTVPPPAGPLAPSLAEHDRAHIQRTLADCGGNIAAAARRLGVSRGLLYRRLRGGRG
jgi:sigma-54 dependent transcriptional regulator, acetoin dehydrogenase operon transcriptional activator AcoR